MVCALRFRDYSRSLFLIYTDFFLLSCSLEFCHYSLSTWLYQWSVHILDLLSLFYTDAHSTVGSSTPPYNFNKLIENTMLLALNHQMLQRLTWANPSEANQHLRFIFYSFLQVALSLIHTVFQQDSFPILSTHDNRH